MSFISIFLISFGLIFTAELGDKTQLMVFTLALRYGGKPVLAGAFLAFALLSGSAAIIGKGLGSLLDQDLITRISAWVFIAFGLYMLFRKGEEEEKEEAKPSARTGFLTAFSLIAISEMGDKTQIATLLLSVKYQSFLSVFLGSLAALSAATLLGVLIAGRLHKFIPAKYISPISGALFILLGLGTLVFA
ncbi:MAG: TMEM165/GDT1 family protein [Nitrospirota bacterium]|nr:TMEM165/GDT1 family protein [Nitrospirota bacterium]